MSVSETKNLSSLKMKFDAGLNNEGKTIVKAHTFSNVKAYATATIAFLITDRLKGFIFRLRWTYHRRF